MHSLNLEARQAAERRQERDPPRLAVDGDILLLVMI
jgi:hypothetical protein